MRPNTLDAPSDSRVASAAPTFAGTNNTLQPRVSEMDDSDEYGEFDDSAFLLAATQAEEQNTTTFQTSLRATKRRKIDHPNERTAVNSPSHGTRTKRNRTTVFPSSD